MHQLPFEVLRQRTQFLFLRHGESEANRAEKIQGHQDSALTEAGRNQAQAAARYFSDKKIDGIFSSPLSRALDTARCVADAAGIDSDKIALRDNLLELDTGIFSGLTFEDAERQYPGEWKNFQERSWEGVPSAESVHELLQRATAVWHELIEVAAGGKSRLLCVSHGGMLQWIIKRSMSPDWQGWMPVLRTGNCGIHVIQVTPLGSEENSGRYYAAWEKINYLPY